MKLLAHLRSEQLTLQAMNEDLLRATLAGSDDRGPMHAVVDRQNERVAEMLQELLEALRTA